MAAPKQSVFTRRNDPGSLYNKEDDYDLYGGQGNVNADQSNDYTGTTPVSKASQALKALKKVAS